jgi:hypothetical protein
LSDGRGELSSGAKAAWSPWLDTEPWRGATGKVRAGRGAVSELGLRKPMWREADVREADDKGHDNKRSESRCKERCSSEPVTKLVTSIALQASLTISRLSMSRSVWSSLLSRFLAQFCQRCLSGPKGWRNPDGVLSVDDPFRNAWVRIPPSTPPSGGVLFAAICVALHRVSIRTLDELSCCKLGAGWGSRGESMLPFIGRPRGPKSARSHRKTVSSQRVNMVISQAACS